MRIWRLDLRSKAVSVLVFLIVFLVFLANIVNDIYLPSLPALAKDLACSDDQVVMTMTSFCVGVVVAEVFFGYLINRQGKRFSLLFSTIVFLAGIVWAFGCQSVGALIAARFVQGVGVSGLNVSSIAVAKDNFARKDGRRFISYITLTGALAPLLGPVVGGYIDTYFSWRFSFELLAGLTIITFVLLLPQTTELDVVGRRCPGGDTGSFFPVSEMFQLLTSRQTLLLFIGLFILVFGLVSYLVYSPFLFIDRLEVSSKNYGLMQLPVFSVYMAGLYLNERIAARLPARVIINCAIALLGAAVLILGWEFIIERPSYAVTCVAMSFFAAIYGFFMPLLVSRINFLSQASSGVTSTTVHLSMSLGSLAGALVYALSWEKHFVFFVFFLLSAAVIGLVVKKEEEALLQQDT